MARYRKLQFFRDDPNTRVFVDGMAHTRAKLGYLQKNPITGSFVERDELWV